MEAMGLLETAQAVKEKVLQQDCWLPNQLTACHQSGLATTDSRSIMSGSTDRRVPTFVSTKGGFVNHGRGRELNRRPVKALLSHLLPLLLYITL